MHEEIPFAQLIAETKHFVLAAVRRYLHHEIDAMDDVIQETYLRAFRALRKNQFRGDAKLSTYLYRIATNECHRMNARHAREGRKWNSAREQYGSRRTADEAEAITEQELQALLPQVPEPYRTVLQLFSSGLSEKEIALRLSVSPGTVKSRKSRGKATLLKLWEGQAGKPARSMDGLPEKENR